jgi:hypothetical protein
MIGTSGATVLFAVNVFFAGLLGIVAGSLTRLVRRRPWIFKDVVLDAIAAAVVAVIAAYLVSAIDNARGVWESRISLVFIISVGSVVIRNLIPARQSRN